MVDVKERIYIPVLDAFKKDVDKRTQDDIDLIKKSVENKRIEAIVIFDTPVYEMAEVVIKGKNKRQTKKIFKYIKKEIKKRYGEQDEN